LAIAPDELATVGLDPDIDFASTSAVAEEGETRRRNANRRRQIVAAWDRARASCGFDGALLGAPVGIGAAHVQWFNVGVGGPDNLDNGLALCSLHHKCSTGEQSASLNREPSWYQMHSQRLATLGVD